ncbi:MAG: TetR/AcrR family transcriptional regulator [Myxococcales bacterium]|nr:TetR/AcrR family transcriptional regulator [Myxococcales bacterium]
MCPRPRFASLQAAKRDAILAAAAKEFAERGFEAASYNRLIERAGVSKGAMYYYFDDKQDLYVTTVGHAVAVLQAAIGELDDFDDADDFWTALIDLYQRVLVFFLEEPVMAALLKGVTHPPPAAASGVDRSQSQAMERFAKYFEAVIHQGVRVGGLRDDVPADLLLEILLGMGDAMDRWTIDRFETLDEKQIQTLLRTNTQMFMRVAAPLSLVQRWEGQFLRPAAEPL